MALVPLWVAVSGWSGRPDALAGRSFRRGFFLGLLTGIVHFAGTVYWTGATVQTFGGLPWPVAVVTAFLLVFYMALYARLMRGQVLSVKAREHVEAAVAGGAGHARTLVRHILPLCWSPRASSGKTPLSRATRHRSS